MTQTRQNFISLKWEHSIVESAYTSPGAQLYWSAIVKMLQNSQDNINLLFVYTSEVHLTAWSEPKFEN